MYSGLVLFVIVLSGKRIGSFSEDRPLGWGPVAAKRQ